MLRKEETGTCKLASMVSAQTHSHRKQQPRICTVYLKAIFLFQPEEPTLEMTVLSLYIIKVIKIPVD